MFLMRAHDPHRFGAQPAAAPRHGDAAGQHLAQALGHLDDQARRALSAEPLPAEPPRLTGPRAADASVAEIRDATPSD